jgi:thiosulfate dehydrogenase
MGHSLSRLADLLAAPNAEQVVRGMRRHLQTKELLPDDGGKPRDAR